MKMNMIKKLVLAALLVPSSMIVASQPPVQVAEAVKDTIMSNLGDSAAGFQKGLYNTALAFSRFILSASKGADALGTYFADNHLIFGCAATASLLGLGYLYFKRPTQQNPTQPTIFQRAGQLVQDGKNYAYDMYGRVVGTLV